MSLNRDQIATLIGFEGEWKTYKSFKINPQTYGYLSPIQWIHLEPQGIRILSSPLTNTEWWTNLMPINTCPRYRGQELAIDDDYNPFCQQGECTAACGAEDGFVELSAARFRLIDDSEYMDQLYPRLKMYLNRAIKAIEETNQEKNVAIGLNLSTSAVTLQARIGHNESQMLGKYCDALKYLYPDITHFYGKVDTSTLPPDYNFSGETEEEIMAEARYYALKEAVKLESVDILNFLISKKGGHMEEDEENQYILPNEKLAYTLYPTKIEAFRDGLYMGTVGFNKGVNELQQFFSTTLGGGRW